MEALITGDFGREFLAQTADRLELVCTRKGKKQDVAVGDEVDITLTGAGRARIDRVFARKNVLFRADQWKEKTLAANIDQVVVIIAPRPSFSEQFLNMCLIACEAAGIPVIVMLNKKDLPDYETARAQVAYLEKLDYPVLPMSAKFDIEPLRHYLDGKTTLLVGQSGMGKSRTVNNLVMRDVAKVGDLSEALDSGKHTTTFTRLYRLDDTTTIIDTPGLQSFGLFHLSDDDVGHAMREFRPYLGRCKFNDCAHLNEPQCAVIAAAETAHTIHTTRLSFYQVLIDELRDLREAHPEWKR
jgi:ribosome biogenesis GTPase